jgi:hypothetical protein
MKKLKIISIPMWSSSYIRFGYFTFSLRYCSQYPESLFLNKVTLDTKSKNKELKFYL